MILIPDPWDEEIDDPKRAETGDRRWQQEPRSRDRGVMCHASLSRDASGQLYGVFLGSEGEDQHYCLGCRNKISRKHKHWDRSRQQPDKCKYKQTNSVCVQCDRCWLKSWHHDIRVMVTRMSWGPVSCPDIRDHLTPAPGHLGTRASVLPALALSSRQTGVWLATDIKLNQKYWSPDWLLY